MFPSFYPKLKNKIHTYGVKIPKITKIWGYFPVKNTDYFVKIGNIEENNFRFHSRQASHVLQLPTNSGQEKVGIVF